MRIQKIYKLNEKLINLFLVILVHVQAYDYTITGRVESIAFGSWIEFPCYISMAAETDNQPAANRIYYFHKVKSVEMCKFAERTRASREPVKIYASVQSDVNSVDSIEYAYTAARWWNP